VLVLELVVVQHQQQQVVEAEVELLMMLLEVEQVVKVLVVGFQEVFLEMMRQVDCHLLKMII
jgi:hypothetical protein